MKRKDWAVIAVVGIISAVISIIISGSLFGSPSKNPIKVPVVQKISSEFPVPQTDDNYKKFFNQNAFDPTQLIQIGGSNNTTPFQTGQGQ
jgi:hypothetical protein